MKKCLIGIVGQYRTFMYTGPIIINNLIKNNIDKYEFDIILNTDKNNLDIFDPYDKIKNKIIYPEIDDKLKLIYNIYLKQIIYYNVTNINTGSTEIFFTRINQILNECSDLYDLYIFLRFDVIFTKDIILEQYNSNNLNIICGSGNHSFNLDGNLNRLDHYRDWDLCFIGNKKVFDCLIKKQFTNYTIITYKLFIEYVNKIINHKSRYVMEVINRKEIFPHWWLGFIELFYNMYIKDNIFVKFDEDIYMDIIR